MSFSRTAYNKVYYDANKKHIQDTRRIWKRTRMQEPAFAQAIAKGKREWWIAIKKQCVEYMGGKCSLCGYNKNLSCLDFHHKNPEEKDYDIATQKCFESLKPELDKCILLCRNCHNDLHHPGMRI